MHNHNNITHRKRTADVSHQEVFEDDTLCDATKKLLDSGEGLIPVLSAQGICIGILNTRMISEYIRQGIGVDTKLYEIPTFAYDAKREAYKAGRTALMASAADEE